MSESGGGRSGPEPGRVPSEEGAAISAARSALPSWNVEQVSESPVDNQAHHHTDQHDVARAADVTGPLPSTPSHQAIQPANQLPPNQLPPSRRKSWLLGLLGLILVCAVGALGFWFGTQDSGTAVASDTTVQEEAVANTDPAAPESQDDTAGTAEDDTAGTAEDNTAGTAEDNTAGTAEDQGTEASTEQELSLIHI